MSEENKMVERKQSDFNQYYTVMRGYVEYCIRNPKVKLTDKEKEGISDKEFDQKEEELNKNILRAEEQKKVFQSSYEVMCESIIKEGSGYLSTYVDVLTKLYIQEIDWKRDIKTALIEPKSLKLFRDARAKIIDLYPILVKVNKTFPVDDYSELSLHPRAALYGSIVNKTQHGSTIKAPLKNEEMQAMLTLFLQVKDYKHFKEWIMAILFFIPNQVVEAYAKEWIPQREILKKWIYEQIRIKESYKRAVMDSLLEDKMLNSLVDAFVELPAQKNKVSNLEEQVKILEENNKKEATAHEQRRLKQLDIIKEQETNIETLYNKLREFDRCKVQLNGYVTKYQVQCSMNERITSDNERRLNEIQEKYNHIQTLLEEKTAQLNELTKSHADLQSDYSLKNNEFIRLKESFLQREETARIEMMKELVDGIKEQFYYLTLFYLELRDTGKLGSEGIELYADTLDNIDNVFAELGIKKIGVIDQMVEYDTALYSSTDAKISNGETVKVSGYGWKIGSDVYIKAPVEKGE